MNLDHIGVLSPRQQRRSRRQSRQRPSQAQMHPQPRAAHVLPSPDINISNGTCYAGTDLRLDRRFLACGNAAIAAQACCWAGDVCLEDRACFGVHDGDYVTYLAGCTDAAYADAAACPDKRGAVVAGDAVVADDAIRAAAAAAAPAPPWVGLAYCNGTSDQWVVCPQPHAPATLQSAAPCACPTPTTARTVAFAAGPSLAATAQLPAIAGGRIVWVSPYTPTQPATTTASVPMSSSSSSSLSSSPAPSSSSLFVPSATRAPTAAAGPDVALLVGLSVGIGGFVLLAALAGVALCLSARRSRRTHQQVEARRLDSSSSSSHGSSTSGGGGIGGGGRRARLWWPARWTKAVEREKKGKQPTADEAPCFVGADVIGEKGEGRPSSEEKVPVTAPAVSPAPDPPALLELELRPARPWSMRSELEGSSVGAAPVSPVSPGPSAAHARSSIGTVLTSGWLDIVREEDNRGSGGPASGTPSDTRVLAELEG